MYCHHCPGQAAGKHVLTHLGTLLQAVQCSLPGMQSCHLGYVACLMQHLFNWLVVAGFYNIGAQYLKLESFLPCKVGCDAADMDLPGPFTWMHS